MHLSRCCSAQADRYVCSRSLSPLEGERGGDRPLSLLLLLLIVEQQDLTVNMRSSRGIEDSR